MATPWTWDANRRAYYVWNEEEDCYIYTDGSRVNRDPSAQPATEQHPPDQPRTEISQTFQGQGGIGGNLTGSEYYNYVQSNYSQGGHSQSGYNQGGYNQSSFNQDGFNQGRFNQSSNNQSSNNQGNYHQGSQYGMIYALNKQTNEQVMLQRNRQSEREQPVNALTDASMAALGPHAIRRLGETQGQDEKLDPRFRVRHPSFFSVGRVFKIFWPEMAGDINSGVTIATVKYGAEVALKIRWFAVVKEGQNCCSCLPIQTYSRRGVGKTNLIKAQHAIVFTRTEPSPEPAELPKPGEFGMLSSIKVKRRNPQEKMDVMSRINFAKIYTVEHNVKVYDFGQIDERYMELFISQFHNVWRIQSNASRIYGQSQGVQQQIEEHEDEDEDEDEDDDDDEKDEP